MNEEGFLNLGLYEQTDKLKSRNQVPYGTTICIEAQYQKQNRTKKDSSRNEEKQNKETHTSRVEKIELQAIKLVKQHKKIKKMKWDYGALYLD